MRSNLVGLWLVVLLAGCQRPTAESTAHATSVADRDNEPEQPASDENEAGQTAADANAAAAAADAEEAVAQPSAWWVVKEGTSDCMNIGSPAKKIADLRRVGGETSTYEENDGNGDLKYVKVYGGFGGDQQMTFTFYRDYRTCEAEAEQRNGTAQELQ